ncbi:MAG: polynucleotide adenylyltransferase [Planctomycetes bacterium]|nr:polynucleotide adenylyltransferase [Planctomycetota bacterium]MCP4771937.1 polynucleotide adenylyltransferase [Planctomycetota bacterium]MCP4860412.1 polynucleotide adenylyltransferase [Planctomycetota bacterium]
MSLLALAVEIATAARDAGGRALMVGGAVRDRLLGLPAKDLDMEVYGLTAEQLEELGRGFGSANLVGQRFAVLNISTDRGIAELSLPRRESKTGPGHKGFEVTADPNMDFADACRRRDFTVNAMLEDPLTGEIIDPYNGRADLQRGVLRHVSSAFAEDPLRVLRAARFAARFNWKIHPSTSELCRQLDLSELPRERIEGEWRHILAAAYPGTGLLALELCGALRFFPELQALRGVPQDPIWHPEGDVLQHTAYCLNAAVQRRPEMEDWWIEMLAVMCHDLGKAEHTYFERGRWRCPNHDSAGEPYTRSLLERLNGHKDVAAPVVALVKEHLRPSQLYFARDQVSDAGIRRLALRVDIPALCRVSWSDAAGRLETMPLPWEPEEWLLERAARLGVKEQAPANFLRGADLLERGWPGGREVGLVLARAFELQLDGKLADREAALAWLDQQRA